MENINSLEAALGFMAGCGATGTVLWAAIISPLKSELKDERAQYRDFMNRILRKAGYDVG